MYAASYVWAKVLRHLEQQLTEPLVQAWFDETEVVELTEDSLILYTPSKTQETRLRATCTGYIEDALLQLFNIRAKVTVQSHPHRQPDAVTPSRFTFENFIPGTTNAIPLRIATAVAAAPGMDIYNPIFLYGPPGVGKTHLLYAIAGSIAENLPEKNVACIKGEQFTTELITAIRDGTTALFREKYRRADVLLVDDIQFLAGKEATQEEFFHTFNALFESGKQIVLTADRKPGEMATLEERLRSRFGVGVTVRLNPPDPETRLLITKAKAAQLGLPLGDEGIAYIAENFTDSVRHIEGALKKLRAYRDLAGLSLTPENIQKTLADMCSAQVAPAVTPALILRNVCKYYDVAETALKGPQRSRNISEPRQVAMYLMRQLLHMSQDDIAREFSRDRTTVIHALNQVEKKISSQEGKLELILHNLTSNITAT